MSSGTKTNEFSFVIKPSTIKDAGVGVFAVHDIAAGAKLALGTDHHNSRRLNAADVPRVLLKYCVASKHGGYLCPKSFTHIEIGWFINHSDNPNVELRSGGHYAKGRIEAGEELLMDYNQLDEPKAKKEEFYEE